MGDVVHTTAAAAGNGGMEGSSTGDGGVVAGHSSDNSNGEGADAGVDTEPPCGEVLPGILFVRAEAMGSNLVQHAVVAVRNAEEGAGGSGGVEASVEEAGGSGGGGGAAVAAAAVEAAMLDAAPNAIAASAALGLTFPQSQQRTQHACPACGGPLFSDTGGLRCFAPSCHRTVASWAGAGGGGGRRDGGGGGGGGGSARERTARKDGIRRQITRLQGHDPQRIPLAVGMAVARRLLDRGYRPGAAATRALGLREVSGFLLTLTKELKTLATGVLEEAGVPPSVMAPKPLAQLPTDWRLLQRFMQPGLTREQGAALVAEASRGKAKGVRTVELASMYQLTSQMMQLVLGVPPLALTEASAQLLQRLGDYVVELWDVHAKHRGGSSPPSGAVVLLRLAAWCSAVWSAKAEAEGWPAGARNDFHRVLEHLPMNELRNAASSSVAEWGSSEVIAELAWHGEASQGLWETIAGRVRNSAARRRTLRIG